MSDTPDQTGPDDSDFSADELDWGRRLFARECRFIIGAAGLAQLPPGGLPEIAFAGRSNVGKSSLINALTGRNTLARTSNTPGRTQQLNFFSLDDKLMLADLPGYGFAKAPKGIVATWQQLIDAYLKGRVPLRRVCVLIDSRHGMKKVDREIVDMLDKAAVTYQVVMTKADKIKPTQLAKTVAQVTAEIIRHPAAHPKVLVTSSQKGTGIAEVRAELAALALTD